MVHLPKIIFYFVFIKKFYLFLFTDNKEPDIASAVQSQQTSKAPFGGEESCNSNINANDLVLEDVLPEEDLIDNFRCGINV